jgi:type IV pilus assembly protein PilM
MFFGGGKTYTGLDVGASSIKLVRGSIKGGKMVVEKLSIEPLSFAAHNEQGIADPVLITSAISRAMSEFSGAARKTTVAIHGGGVLTKRITIPKVPQKDIPDQVRWEAQQVFPVDVESILLDHVLLGEGVDVPGAPAGTKGWDLLLVGVRIDDAEKLRSCVEQADIEIKALDLDTFVTSNWLGEVLDLPKDEAIAFVDVGALATRVSVSRNGKVAFFREFPIAGRFFTESMAGALGLSFDDAEALKIQDASAIPEEAVSALQAAIIQWKADLQQTEDIFVTQDSHLITRWYFFGGGHQTVGLMESLQDERFGSKVYLLPFEEIFVGKGGVDDSLLRTWAPRLITAAGSAVRKG